MKGSLRYASQSFICRCRKIDRPITDGLNTDLHLDIGNGVSLEKVDIFCYLGDMLNADGCDSLNLTLRLSLTLTLLLQTPRTLNYRRAARHPNRLRSPFCTNTRSSTAHQQQVHNISTTTTTSPQLVVQ